MPGPLLRPVDDGHAVELRHPVTGHRVRIRPRTHTAEAALRAVAEAGFGATLRTELRTLAARFPGVGWDGLVRWES